MDMLPRIPRAAARLDRAAQSRVLDPLTRLDAVVLRRLLPLLAALRLALRRAVVVPVDGLAALVAEWVLPPSATTDRPARHAAAPRLGRRLEGHVRELALSAGLVLLAGVAALGLPAAPEPQVAVQVAAETRDRPGPWLLPGIETASAPTEARLAPPDLILPTPTSTTTSPPTAAAVPSAEPAVESPPPPPEPKPRWLPTGTGMWLHNWTASEGGHAPAVVARSQAAGVNHLYVQTGSSKKGWIGDEVLGQLLPATAGTGIKVIAWDFPKLIDPEGDARRMAHAAWWGVHDPAMPRVAAVAPDVETAAEGTHLSPDAVTRYYATLRAELPPEVAVLATVPWPSENRTGFYPYGETAAHSDAFVPMAYWYNRAPYVVTQTSMEWLAQFGLPVMPVGQGYDGRIDAPYLAEDPDPGASVQAFVDAARAGGARSISLWSWQTMYPQAWDVLTGASAAPWPAGP